MRRKVKYKKVDEKIKGHVKFLDRRFPLKNKLRIQTIFSCFYGLDRTGGVRLSSQVGVLPSFPSVKLPFLCWSRLEKEIDRRYETGRPFEKEVKSRLQELKKIGCYRGLRLLQGLPVRGQRTHTNGRTMKRLYRNVSKKKI